MMLSTHFSLEEFFVSEYAMRKGLDNQPTQPVIDNLRILAATMEKVRTTLNDNPIKITSGYRAPMVNAGVGGAKDSAHLHGYAADFICPQFGQNLFVAETIVARGMCRFDQLILEYGWVHISIAPTMRGMLLTKRSAEAPYEDGLNP